MFNPIMAIKKLVSSVMSALVRRKPLDLASTKETNLDRCLSTLDLTFIGMGTTFGAGIYILTGEVARNKAGPAVILSYVIACIGAILSGLCYAECGTRFPKAGSAYVYCYVALGEVLAFLTGWNLLAEGVFGTSAVVRGASVYIDSLANGIIKNTTISITGEINIPGFSHYFDFLAVLIISVITIILVLGIKTTSRVNSVLTIFNIVIILFATGAGFAYAEPKNWSDFTPYGFTGIIKGAVTCFYTLLGFDIIALMGEEAKDPAKSIPRSILGTICTCAFVYLTFSSALTLLVPYTELTNDISIAFGQRNMLFMRYIIGTGATIAMLTGTFVGSAGPPRLLYAMSVDGLLPSIFSNVSQGTKTPITGTILMGLIVALFSAILDVDALVNMISMGTLFAFSIVNITVLVLRYQTQKTEQNTNECFIYSSKELMNERKDGLWKRMLKSPVVIKVVIFGMLIQVFGVCFLMAKCSKELFEEKNSVYLTFWIILIVCVVGSGIFLMRLPAVTDELHFCVPCMPWIPIAGIIFNASLMIEMNPSTWLRYLVWMAVGLVVYFGFSVHHSVAAKAKYETVPKDMPEEESMLCASDEQASLVASGNAHDD